MRTGGITDTARALICRASPETGSRITRCLVGALHSESLLPHANQAEQRGLQELFRPVHHMPAFERGHEVIVRFAPFGFQYTSEASLRCANQHIAHLVCVMIRIDGYGRESTGSAGV